MESSSMAYIALIVPKELVKRTKDALQAQQQLDKRDKIRPVSDQDGECILAGDPANVRDSSLYVPTTLCMGSGEYTADAFTELLGLVGLQEHEASISIIAHATSATAHISKSSIKDGGDQGQMNLLARTISKWLALTRLHEQQITTSIKSVCKWSYTIYPPLLLLPASDFSTLKATVAADLDAGDFSSLYSMLCEAFKVTHIALNAPIPANVAKERAVQDSHIQKQVMSHATDSAPNILRSPTGLTPLQGDFGPVLSPGHVPTEKDFTSAFWCTARQNGIFQNWAPRYTMFSRGNVTEKARVLELESLTEERMGKKPRQVSAVDLYAGIGYFAFSYAQAGVGKVLCWEINPWSVNGLRRGARGNKWDVKVINSGEYLEEKDCGDETLLVFQESNEHAAKRIDEMRNKIPPVAHVNCGYLPSSKDSWGVAVQVLDPAGGYIHAHENVAKRDIEGRETEIVMIFTELVNKKFGQKFGEQRSIECEHVELVKSYAPGVMHCVFDIVISPIATE
ncbi:hypothetical protein ABVK25_006141 [Lepraria finkii]|uniref:tRNA(Phe) (4-demethylwyosine(37)-C(7)) aminocarboxypropyltransferase n=1 Tax=Lepraria finkii TaxID=1340010 RepID=A0ABR4B6J4_9LECA